jgi:hypothetical protein
MKPGSLTRIALVALAWTAACTTGQSDTAVLPPLKTQPTAAAVLAEHLDALNSCNWERLMAQYPAEVEFFLPAGQVIQGREAVGELFATFVKPFAEGGLCGITFTVEHEFTVDGTVNAQWVATGDFLAEPYRGADAYVTKDGLMYAQVSTFDAAQLKTK